MDMETAPTVAVIPYAPHDGQKAFHASRARVKVLACGARWGKDRSSINEFIKQIITLLALRRGKDLPLTPTVHAWIVAPTYALTAQDWRELNHFMPPALVKKVIGGSAMQMHLHGGALIECKSADKPESLVSVGLDALVVTEAGLISSIAWEQSLQPRLISPGRAGLAYINGTPKGKFSWFYKLYLAGQDPLIPHIASWNSPTRDNPYIDLAEIEGLRHSMPERWFAQEMEAVFLDDGGGVFQHVAEAIAGAVIKVDGALHIAEEPIAAQTATSERAATEAHEYVIGVDLARSYDFTVLTVMDVATRRVVAWERFNKIDWSYQKLRIRRLSRRYNHATVLLDASGVGDPILDDLRQVGLPVEGYTFSAPSKKALIDALVVAIAQRHLTYPELPQLINELQAFEYTQLPSGNVRMAAPEGMHDDCVMSLALSWWKASAGGRFAAEGFIAGEATPARDGLAHLQQIDAALAAQRALDAAAAGDPAPDDDDDDDVSAGIEAAGIAGYRGYGPLTPLEILQRVRRGA